MSIGGIPFARSIEPVGGSGSVTPEVPKHEITLTSEAFGSGTEKSNAGDGAGSLDEVTAFDWAVAFAEFAVGSSIQVYCTFVGREDVPGGAAASIHCRAVLRIGSDPVALGTTVLGPTSLSGIGSDEILDMGTATISTPVAPSMVQFTLVSGSGLIGDAPVSLVANARSVTVRLVEV